MWLARFRKRKSKAQWRCCNRTIPTHLCRIISQYRSSSSHAVRRTKAENHTRHQRGPNEGKSTVSANLAIAWPFPGPRTLLIDAICGAAHCANNSAVIRVLFAEVLQQEHRGRRLSCQRLIPLVPGDAWQNWRSQVNTCSAIHRSISKRDLSSIRLHYHR